MSQARARLEQAGDRLSKTRIYAPINGKVTSLDIEVRETAISSSTNIRGSSLMTIADRAEICTASREDVLAVPIQAIQIEQDPGGERVRYHVFVHRDGTARRVDVETGISADAYQQISGAIGAGAGIIVGPDCVLRELGDGDAVSLAGGGDA